MTTELAHITRRDLFRAAAIAAVPALRRRLAGAPTVTTGLAALIRDNFAPLHGKRVGLVTNPTGIAPDLRSTIDILASAPGVKLAALFGPEHGVRGDAAAGERLQNARDQNTGLPVYSLYGRTRRPTAAMLQGLDALVFDMQDIGSRSYTYISTLGGCMDSCAEHGLPLYVLDRPNPIGGERVEGNITEPGFVADVSQYPIAYCHGMTMGELARMINGEGWLRSGRKCDLHVISMIGWRRDMTWADTRLPWVPTSPHIPHARTSLFYAATGIVGELSTLSIGVGYTLPFELAGAPGIDPHALTRELERRRLGGFQFRPSYWRPFYAVHKGQPCGGVQIYIDESARPQLSRLNFELMEAVRRLVPGKSFFGDSAEETRMFDLSCGTDRVRRQFQAGRSASQIWENWSQAAEGFARRRKPYLL